MADNHTPNPFSWDWPEWGGIELANGSHALVRVQSGQVRLAVQDTEGRESVVTLGSAVAKAVGSELERASIDAFRAEHTARRTAPQPPRPAPPAPPTERRDIANVVGIRLAGTQLNVSEVLALLTELGFDIEYGSTTPATEPGTVHVNAMVTPSPDRPGRWLTPDRKGTNR